MSNKIFPLSYLFKLIYNYDTMITNIVVKPITEKKTRASILVDTLLELGVDSIFGYPGASILSIYNELSYTNKITHYLVRHEQAAVHAAEGYARVSGNVGVVLVTSGPGFTNTITGIANAYTDLTPLVVLAGDIPSTGKTGKTFQKVDIVSMTKSCTKKTYMLQESDDIREVIKNAFKLASSGIPGPVVVALPRNILEMVYKKNTNKSHVIENKKLDFSKYNKQLNALISASEKPLILIGGGAMDANNEINRFVEKYRIPVVSTLMGTGIYPSEHNLYLGMAGINGVRAANEALKNCDLLIAFGAAFSDRSTCKKNEFAKNAKVVSINLESISPDFELEIKSDVKEFINQFLVDNKIQTKISSEKWLKYTDKIKGEFVQNERGIQCLHSSYVLATLSEYTKRYEPIVVTDVGQHQMLTAQFFNFNKPRKFITSGGLGTMGFGLPAAIGAHIANPNNLILNITGDGSYQMNLQELATCREHNIPIKIIIMNNGYLGMVRQIQEKLYNNRYQVEMTNPDFVKIAEAYDLFAIRVKKKDELIPALSKAIKHKGTAIIDIVIDSFENI